MKVITEKCTAVIFTIRGQVPRKRVKLFEEVPWSAETKYLGVHIGRSLTFESTHYSYGK
jgi:hypothetical protein